MAKKTGAILTAVLIVAITIGWSWPGKKKEEPPKAAEPPAAVADSETGMQHKVLSFNLEGLADNGSKKWEVTGQSAEAVSENEIRLDKIVAKAYGDEAEATITADQGVYDKAKNNVKLEKNVNATILAANNASSDYLDFAAPAGGAKPDTTVKKEKTKTLITCDGDVMFDYEKNVASFNTNVQVASDEFQINSDRITVNLDPGTKKIKDIVAEGNVRIRRGENITYSDKAIYVEADKKIILTGRPKLVIYQEGNLGEGFLSEPIINR